MKPSITRELEALTYEDKLRHWDDDDPWSPPSGSYRFSNPDLGKFRTTMLRGDITRMPLLVGRPCFGILTAYLRFRNATKFVKGRGQLPASRCGTCKVREQCGGVVEGRINESPQIKAAHDEWLLADGPTHINQPDWRKGRAGAMWKKLVRAALDVPYSSSNDTAVAEHYAEQDRLALERDQQRQTVNRDRERRAGILDDGHLADLWASTAARAKTLVEAIVEAKQQGHPKELATLPKESVRELLDVWLGRETLKATKQKATAAAIARWIFEKGLRNQSKNLDALSTRVSRDLKRIARFESIPWQGGVLLPPFDPSEEFH